jgi:hypothetical protein
MGRLLAGALVSLLVASQASAQYYEDYADESPAPERKWSIATGVGFTASPTNFLLGVDTAYWLSENVAIGPLLQFGIGDDTIIAPTANVHLEAALPKLLPEAARLFVQGGIGFAYINPDGRRSDDAGFLANFGLGFEVELSPVVSLGSNMLFNFLPEKTAGEHFFYSWQIGTMRIRF